MVILSKRRSLWDRGRCWERQTAASLESGIDHRPREPKEHGRVCVWPGGGSIS